MTIRATVQGQTLARPRVGLLTAANEPETGDMRWQAGFAYSPESTCDVPRIVADPCGITDGDIDPYTEPADVLWEPYIVHAAVTCTALGSVGRDDEARARRRLAATEQRQIERELWRGDRAQAAGWDNRYLAAATAEVVSGASSGVSLAHGLACLEEYLADALDGRVGMIHATRQAVTHWAALDLIRREGNLLLTVHDTRVVPGSGGYDGSGPGNVAAADGSVWAYATELVDVRLGEIDVRPSFDYDLNDPVVVAQRIAVASWDGCAHGAVRLDLTTCASAGS